MKIISAVLALEVAEGLEEVQGCSQQRMADCLAEDAGSSVPNQVLLEGPT